MIKLLAVLQNNKLMSKLSDMLTEYNEIELAGTYQTTSELIQAIPRMKPDAVILDNASTEEGRTLVRIYASCPQTEMIVLAGQGLSAEQAYDLEVLDYVADPINSERLSRIVLRLLKHKSGKTSSQEERPPTNRNQIRCLGPFSIKTNSDNPFSWRTKKEKELLSYLLHYRNHWVGQRQLMWLLWPETDEARSLKSLRTAIYNMRKALETHFAPDEVSIENANHCFRLKTTGVTLDAEQWETDIESFVGLKPNSVSHYRELLERYAGHYFQSENYVWAEPERERLRAIWIKHAKRIAEFYRRENLDTAAAEMEMRLKRMEA